VLLNQNDTGLLLMIAYLLHNHPMWRKCKLRVLIPIPPDEKDFKAHKRTKVTWDKYLEKIRISAVVEVFICPQTSSDLNYALRNSVNNDQTKLTLMSMRRDPEVSEDEGDVLIPKKVDLDAWLEQCRVRVRGIDSCIFVWNAGMAVIQE